MAQDITIRTLCDVCLSDDEERRDAKPYTIGEGPVTLEIDLCDIHRKPLADLIAHARPQDKPMKTGQVCPACGRGFGTTNGLRRHMTTSHGASGETSAALSLATNECPTCKRGFPTRQGLSMHRFRAHGIRSETPEAIRKREAQGSA